MLSPLFGGASGSFIRIFWFRLFGHAFPEGLFRIAGSESELWEHHDWMTCCPGELLELLKESSYQRDDGTRLLREAQLPSRRVGSFWCQAGRSPPPPATSCKQNDWMTCYLCTPVKDTLTGKPPANAMMGQVSFGFSLRGLTRGRVGGGAHPAFANVMTG